MKKGSRRFNSLLIDTFTFCFWSEESICSPIFFKTLTNHLIGNIKTSLHIVHREIHLSSGFDSIVYMLGLICFTYIVNTIWNSRAFCVVCLARCLYTYAIISCLQDCGVKLDTKSYIFFHFILLWISSNNQMSKMNQAQNMHIFDKQTAN